MAVHETLTNLAEKWCDERNYRALSHFLPGWLSLNGLADGWQNLLESLKKVRAHSDLDDRDKHLVNVTIAELQKTLKN